MKDVSMKSENINRYNSTDFRRVEFPMTQIFSWKRLIKDNDFYEENVAGELKGLCAIYRFNISKNQ